MKISIFLITSFIFLSSCSMGGKDTKIGVPEKNPSSNLDCKTTGCSAGESCTSIMYECKNGSGELSKCESYQCVKS